MKSPIAIPSKLTCCLLACALASGLAAQATVLIGSDINNGSFEYVNGVNNPAFTTKIAQWDGHSAGEIDNWTLWSEIATSSNDSGTEYSTTLSSDGVRFGFLQPGNAVFNLTSYVIAAGDTFTFTWDHVRGDYDHTVTLVYFDGSSVLPITGSEINSGTTTGNGKGNTFTISEGNAAIGYAVGIGVINNSADWPNVDNFTLTVTSVPEPATAAYLLAAVLGGLVMARRVSRRTRI